MADSDDLLQQFSTITGVDAGRSRFHLESASWNLQVALANFYEEPENEMDEGSAADPVQIDDVEDDMAQVMSSHVSDNTKSGKPSGKSTNSRFATLSSLHGDENSSSEEEGQAFYAGGSERSGQQVLGPSKRKDKSNVLVSDIFKSAKEHGAEELDKSAELPRPGRSAFIGTGYRLGETDAASETVAGPSVKQRPASVDMVLKMWQNGFSVDDGPLRGYDDEANREFLDSIRRGEVPSELVHLARGGEVNLNMEDHRQEEYVKPKTAIKAFSGQGHMLGSPVPAVVISNPSSGDGGGALSVSQVSVDGSKPLTTLQIRLADGQSAHPQYASMPFVLMTTFPNRELTDESKSLEEAKLANAVIVQRMK
ncbi:hypothetical protein C0Q70_05031 [Pomacea canaliculata]|uniref:SEP domain-containing protein n=1 Tax=Pomacea canaliculata TaxID=400727 RepID=A0A2T7PK07_POMCA|nr:hypothetical protein C0Q70_05031 [Pomacea canaliculata]